MADNFGLKIGIEGEKEFKIQKVGWFMGINCRFFMIVPSSAGVIGMIFSLLSLIPWVVFVALLMVKFKTITNDNRNAEQREYFH